MRPSTAPLYGFALQEADLPFHGDVQIVDPLPHDELPYLVEFTTEHVLSPGYSFGASFEFGLDLLLGGIESASESGTPPLSSPTGVGGSPDRWPPGPGR